MFFGLFLYQIYLTFYFILVIAALTNYIFLELHSILYFFFIQDQNKKSTHNLLN